MFERYSIASRQVIFSALAEAVRNSAIRWHTPSEMVPRSQDLPISEDAKLVLDKAASLAEGHGCDFVRTEHLLLAFTAITTSHAAAILHEAGISLERLEEMVNALPRTEQQEGNSSSLEEFLPQLGML